MIDETRHTELCFGLATAFGGVEVGPGALPMSGALDQVDLEHVCRDTFLEGCIGETLAALEAEAEGIASGEAIVALYAQRQAEAEDAGNPTSSRSTAWSRGSISCHLPTSRRLGRKAAP